MGRGSIPCDPRAHSTRCEYHSGADCVAVQSPLGTGPRAGHMCDPRSRHTLTPRAPRPLLADPDRILRDPGRADRAADVVAGLLQPHRQGGRADARQFRPLIADPTFRDPLVTTVILATSSAIICCLVAAPMGWLVARTDMPLRRTIRALVTASFVTPPFLGAIAWELLAAPNSGLINQLYRSAIGDPGAEPLFNIYTLRRTDLRDLLLHVSLRLRAGRERARTHSRRPRGRVLDSRRPHVGDGAAHHHSAGAARGARRRAGRVPAGDDAVRLARDPRAARRLPHHDDEDLEPVPVSAQARACRCCLDAAAAADGAAAARRAPDPRPPLLRGGRRQAGRAAPHPPRRVEMGGACARPDRAGEPGVPALRRAPQRGVLEDRLAARLVQELHAAQHQFRVLRIVRHQARVQEHVRPRLPVGHRRHDHRRRDLLSHRAQGDRRLARARLPGDRAGRRARHRARRRPVPFLHAPALRALRHALDPAHRLRHHRAARRLPAASVGVPHGQRRPRGGKPHPRRDAPAVARPHHGAAVAHQRDRHLVLHLRRRDPRDCPPRSFCSPRRPR